MNHRNTRAARSLLAGFVAAALLCASAQGQPARDTSPATPVPPASAATDLGSALDAIFDRWHRADGPGCAVGIAHGGSAPLVRAFGLADLEHDIPVRADTVFEAGSVSKQFTAASVLLLAQQGKLALGDDIHRYLPELPDYGARITVEMLLNHTSGLRDWGEVEALAGWPRTSRVYALADVLAIAARQRSLNYPPGTAYSYTNTGFSLAAIIVQRVSGQSLARFSHEHLFEPLGMTHTAWRDDFRRIVKDRAVAYSPHEGGYEQVMPFEDTYGHGGLLTTVGDLLKWNEALTNGALGAAVTDALQHQSVLTDGRPIGYARGLFLGAWHGEREVAHSGSTAGYRAWLGRYPQARLSIALLCNTADADATALAHAVADLLLPAPASATEVKRVPLPEAAPATAPGAPGPQALARFAGAYSSEEALATWLIGVADDHLTATAQERRALTLVLTALGPDTFSIVHPDIGGKIRFDRDPKGRVTGFTVSVPRVYALTFHRSAAELR